MHILLFLILTQSSAEPSKGDYSPSHDSWNGLGKFLSVFIKEEVPYLRSNNLDWEAVKPDKDILFFLSPATFIPKEKLASFLNNGGTAWVCDDFRQGESIFTALGIPLQKEETSFPIAWPVSDIHPLVINVKTIVTNHPASFEINQAPILAFPSSRRALLAQVNVGSGTLFLLSDPSIFINDMFSRGENNVLVENIARYFKKSGKRVVFLTVFTEKGWPDGIKPDSKQNTPVKEVVRKLFIDIAQIMKEDQTGLRLFLILLLSPFIYITLMFGSNSTLTEQMPPPIITGSKRRVEMKRKFLAVCSILRTDLTFINKGEPSISALVSRKDLFSSEQLKSLRILMPYLTGMHSMESPILEKLTENRLMDLIERGEEFIIILDGMKNY